MNTVTVWICGRRLSGEERCVHQRTESDPSPRSSVWFRITATRWRWSCCKWFRICLKGISSFTSLKKEKADGEIPRYPCA